MLVDMFGYKKVTNAIELLKMYEPKEGYYLAFSGGKDSICIYQLAKMAGVKFDAHYNLTTVDPPELVRFIKTEYPDVEIHRPKETMWELIVRKGTPPTRMIRYCCEILKEGGGNNRVVVLGVRAEESSKRSNRKVVEICVKQNKRMINPIINWLEEDVWEFIRKNGFKYPSLYDQGFRRLGCIGCPMSSNAKYEMDLYPKYKQAYIRTFERMLKAREERQMKVMDTWKTGQDVYDWWGCRCIYRIL